MPEMISAARAAVADVHVAPELSAYAVDLAAASRTHAHVGLGLSTRGVLALIRAARILAGIRGAQFATPDDVKEVAPWVVPHRLTLAPEALLEGVSEHEITQRLLEQTPVPREALQGQRETPQPGELRHVAPRADDRDQGRQHGEDERVLAQAHLFNAPRASRR